jgi:hypothetical protein
MNIAIKAWEKADADSLVKAASHVDISKTLERRISFSLHS